MLLSNKLSMLRKRSNMTQKQLGESIGITGSHISMIEARKRTDLSLRTVCRLAQAFNMSVDEVLCGTEFDLSSGKKLERGENL